MTTEIIERMKLIDVSEQEVARKACELEAKIKNQLKLRNIGVKSWLRLANLKH